MSTRFPVVNNMLDSFFNDDFFRPVSSGLTRAATSYIPALNVQEFPTHFEITLSIPSINPNLVKVEIEDKILSIDYQENSKENTKEESKNGSFVRQEWQSFSSFRRSVILSKEIDHKKPVEAEYERGVLKITVHKMPQTQPKSVNIVIKDEKIENSAVPRSDLD